jgi:CheY-like chemotaxis protein
VEVEFRDTGEGIPAEDLAKIFEPFFTTKPVGQGTGLGLAAVYGTIQQHDGFIKAYSEVNVGTCFHIALPLTDAGTKMTDTSPELVPGIGRILVVDDEEGVRDTACDILEDLGYLVDLAEDGKDGLAQFEKSPDAYDLVLLDMVMPKMNGRECFARMKQIKPDVRVILSSGFTREGELEEMKSNGLNAFIRKPYRSVALSQVIHEVLHPEA